MRIKKNGVTINLTESDIKKLDVFLLTEKVSSTIQQGDTWCDIICKRKIASVGSNGDIVKHIQHALAKGCESLSMNDFGPYNPTKGGGGMSESCSQSWDDCDGKFRKETKKAVEEFQKDANTYSKKGLKVDGIVGANTLKAMCDGLDCGLTKEACGKCNCNEDKKQLPKKDDPGQWAPGEPGFGDGWFDKVDCKTIKACINKIQKYSKEHGSNKWNNLLKCIGYKKPDLTDKPSGECEGCPKVVAKHSINMSDDKAKFIQKCINRGCTFLSEYTFDV